MLAACDAAGVALVPLVAPTTPDERLAAIGARARGFLYTVSVTGTTGERGRACGRCAARCSRAPRRTARCRSRSASASPPPEQAAAAADAGADGVIVGSRLVRAAAEAAERRRGSRAPRSASVVADARRRAPAARLRARMGVLLTLIAGLVVWIVLWALGDEVASTRS